MSEPSPPPIDALLEQCILALEGPDEGAVEAILARHPDAAATLRERLEHLAALGILRARSTADAIPEHLGDFRLLRQIGRGGMGVVYLAEQQALHRHVALKLVHPEQLFFGGARERFRREVLAIARLQHPGIVPILTCGEAENIPYYAMELVHGASLAEVLTELGGTAPDALDGATLRSALQRAMAKKRELAGVAAAPVFEGSWTATCCRLVLDAATALQHAHDQGVLHRDLKPSNLLLTVDGRVRLIDFGLASARGEQRLTRSGATFGSLPYMAPEQVRGDVVKVDARSDVYALGVTMYELLTLSLPHGDGGTTTREQILAGHVEPPARRNRTVHPDAEAICLVAMDVDPARRYQSAAALAADLRAFLDNRTVRARRPYLLLRGLRWARRRPTRAAAVATVFVVLVPGPLALAWQQGIAAAHIQRALDDTDAQRLRAEANFDLALRAVDQLLLRTTEARLASAPRTAELRRALLQDAIAFHETLIADRGAGPDDRRASEDRARAQSRLGSLQADLGDLARAEELLRSAIDALTAALPTSTRPDALRAELAAAWERLAVVYARTDRIADEEAAHTRAIGLFDAIAGATPPARVTESAARARLALAVCLERRQRVADAFAVLDGLERQLAAAPGGTATAAVHTVLWAEVDDNRGILFARTGDTQRAQASFGSALRRLDALPDAARDLPVVVVLRAGLLERLGFIAQQRREWDAAEPLLDRATSDYERLLQDEPSIVRWPVHLASVLSSRATVRAALRGPEAAGPDHDRAVALLEQAIDKAPAETDLRRAFAIALAERASFHQARNDHLAAIVDFDRAASVFDRSLLTNPDDEPTRSNLASLLASHALSLLALDDLPAAREIAARAVAIGRACRSPEGRRSFVELLGTASDLATRSGDGEAALALMQEATDCATALHGEAPDDPTRQIAVALTSLNHGTALVNLRQTDAAIARFAAGLPAARAVARSSTLGRRLLGVLLLRLAAASRGRPGDETSSWFRAAVDETGIDTSSLRDHPTLRELFADPELRRLLPAGHRDR